MPVVMIVDDSAYVRFVLKDRFRRRGWEAVGIANGEAAVAELSRLLPDLVTMDVLMPNMDGIETVRAMRALWNGPVIMVSTQTQGGQDLTWRALEAGASDFVGKPSPQEPLDHVITQIIEKYEALRRPFNGKNLHAVPRKSATRAPRPKAVVIGASTGGPKAIGQVLRHFKAPWYVPVVLVQHMPPNFTASLASRLSQIVGQPVRESPLAPETWGWDPQQIILARGGYHLRLNEGGVWSEPGPRVHGVIPAIDVTALDAVRTFGNAVCLTILTGMGEDGAEAAYQCHQAGGQVVVQDPATAVVWGMPQAALNKTAGDLVAGLDEIGGWLNEVIHHG